MLPSATLRTASFLWLVLLTAIPAGAPAGKTEEQSLAVFIDRARTRVADGHFQAAISDLKFVLQADPQNREARYLLGKTYLDLEQGESAEKELRRAQELGIRGLSGPLAKSLLLQGKYDEVISELKVDAGTPAGEGAQLHALRGAAYLGQGNMQAAEREFAEALELQADNADALVGQAGMALDAGDTEKARTLLQQAVAAQPNGPTAWAAMGRLEHGAGNLDAANEAFGKAIENNPVSAGLRVQRALIRIELDDFRGAQEDIAELKKTSADHPDVAYAEGRLSFRQGHFEEARDQFTKAEASPRYVTEVDFYLGATQFALHADEQAAERLGRYVYANPESSNARRLLAYTHLRLGDLQEAERLLDDLLRTEPDNVELLRAMAELKTGLNDRASASKYLSRAAELDPDSTSTRTQLALNLLRSGAEPAKKGVETLEETFRTDPSSLEAGIALITGYIQAEEYDRAIETAKALQTTNPKSASSWTLMGIAYGAKGDFPESEKAFKKALEVTPGEPSAAANLAALAIRDGKVNEARAYYEESLKHFPNYEKNLLKLAELEQNAGNADAYVAALARAAEANPQSLEPRIRLAKYYSDQHKPADGIAVLRELESTHGDDPRYLATLGWLQLAAGQAPSAVRTFDRGAQAEPTSAAARYYLANAYVVTGDTDRFQEALVEGLRLDPNHPAAAPLIRAYLAQAKSRSDNSTSLAKLKAVAPDQPEVLLIEASTLLERGDFAEARAAFEAGRQRFAADKRWTIGLSTALAALKEDNEAVAVLSNWLAEHPKDVDVLLVLAMTFQNQQRPADALAIYRDLTELVPDNPIVLNNLAWLLRTDDPKAALAHAERAVELTGSRDSKALDTLGTILLQTGQTKRAVEVHKKAFEATPSDPTLEFHYAIALERDGQIELARQVARRALTSPNPFPEKDEAHAMLGRLGKD